MKKTHISHVSQLKHGLYIRAVVNYLGRHWFEVVNVLGKPYNCDWGLCVRVGGSEFPYGVSDLGVGGAKFTKLFKFSSALLLEFEKVEKSGSVFDLIEFIAESKLSSFDKSCLIGSWAVNKRLLLERFENAN